MPFLPHSTTSSRFSTASLRFAAILSLFFAATLVSAFAQKAPGPYIVQVREDLTVRTNPKGYAIGNLYNGDRFYLQVNGRAVEPNKYYAWGRALGTANLCGWLEHKYLVPGGAATAPCSSTYRIETPGDVSFNYLKKYYAAKVNLSTTGGSRTTLIGRTEIWGNWDRLTNRPHHPVTLPNSNATYPLQRGDKVEWRWMAKGETYAMVHLTPTDLPGRVNSEGMWVFIRRSALRPDLSSR